MAETPCFFVLKESALQLLADLGSLTDAAAQVIQLGAANITAAHGLDLLDEGGVDGEHLLDADAVGKTTNGEGLLKTAVLLRDDDALEDLDTLAGAFLDLDMTGISFFSCWDSSSLMRSMDIFLLFIGVLDRFSSALSGLFHPRTAEDRPFQAMVAYHIPNGNASIICKNTAEISGKRSFPRRRPLFGAREQSPARSPAGAARPPRRSARG